MRKIFCDLCGEEMQNDEIPFNLVVKMVRQGPDYASQREAHCVMEFHSYHLASVLVWLGALTPDPPNGPVNDLALRYPECKTVWDAYRLDGFRTFRKEQGK